MGLSKLHYTQKGWPCLMVIRLSKAQQPHCLKAFSTTLHSGYISYQRGQYTHFTKIDLSMMFYCFELSDRGKRICVISTEENNYSYNIQPTSHGSQDFSQCRSAIHDGHAPKNPKLLLGIWTKVTFDDHLKVVDVVLSRLHTNNMKCNPLKCEWFVKETNFLGFWMTPQGIKPWKKCIDAILKMQRPETTQMSALSLAPSITTNPFGLAELMCLPP